MTTTSLDPRGVDSRDALAEYLSQSLLDEYYERVDGKVVKQVAPSLKTYVMELHRSSSEIPELPKNLFRTVESTAESSLIRLVDRKDGAYFLDALDERFVLLHTIEKTNKSDAVVRRLLANTPGADRCWLSSRMLENLPLGRMIGFRLGHQPELAGLEESEASQQLAKDLGRNRPPAFKMYLREYAHAGEDLAEIRSSTRFGRTAALTMGAWRRSGPGGDGFVHDEVWSSGKVSAHGTSWEAHLGNVLFLRSKYEEVVRSIEEMHRTGWSDNGMSGQPIEIRFEQSPITNVQKFAHDLVMGAGDFNMIGVTEAGTDTHVGVEAVDLHTGGRFSLDIYSNSVIVYLKRSTCGNVFLRFLTNLERHVSAQVETSLDHLLSGEQS